MNEEKALEYFDTLTTILKQGKGVAKVVTGVAQNAEVMVLVQPEVNSYP